MVLHWILVLLFGMCSAIWIGEEYWTTVNRDGTLLGGRTVEDFLTFHAIHYNIPLDNAYVAFWITNDEYGHYETFGHAYVSGTSVCARFVDRQNRARGICGGFRVLSRSSGSGTLGFKFVPAGEADIHQAVEYRNNQIAKIVSFQKNEAWYGSARMNERTADGIDYNSNYVKISYQEDPIFYNQHVFILVSCSRDDPHAGKSAKPYYADYRTPKEDRIYFDQIQRQQQQQEWEKREKQRDEHERLERERERQWREQQERERDQREHEGEQDDRQHNQQEYRHDQQESEREQRELYSQEHMYQEFYPGEKWKL